MIFKETVQEYAEMLNMSLETAEKRLKHFEEVRKDMEATRKCPKCSEYSLVFEGGEWESGVKDSVYCTNYDIPKIDELDETIYVECGFTDVASAKYLFASEHDFDVVLMTAIGIDINDAVAVQNHLGTDWATFVAEDTASLTKDYLKDRIS